MSVSKLRKRGFRRERVAEGMFCFSMRIMSSFLEGGVEDQHIWGYEGWDFAGEKECAERGRTNSLASSRECSANRTADFRGSPDSSVI